MAESVVKYSYNGTEYSFVSKDPAQIEDLKCAICLELVYEPVLTSCGHLFCQRCVKEQTNCPTCRAELQCMRNQRDERRVKCLKVKCPNSEKGCKWQGDLGDTAEHTGTNCLMQTILCPNGCKEMTARGRLKEHVAACTLRVYKCPHCQFDDTYIYITTTHLTFCEDFLLSCPARCRNLHPRGKMAAHLAGCAEELVPCKYAALGCEKVVKRKNLQTHLQDRKDYHLERSMDMVMQLSRGLLEVSTTMRMMAAGEANCDINRFPIPFRPWLQNMPTCYPHPPWIIKMVGFQVKKKYNMQWFSDPVYSHFGGYKMCLGVDANGNGEGKGTHVSVFTYLMRGDNDNNLKWPFSGTIKVSLLNQLEDGQHHTKQLRSPECSSERVTEGERANSGRGLQQFISYQDLDRGCQFLKHDTLFFRVDCIAPKLD